MQNTIKIKSLSQTAGHHYGGLCWAVSLAVFLAMTINMAHADSRTTGLGVVFGEPTGFTGKFWTAPDRAVDAGLAFSINNFVLIYSDYLFHFHGALGTSTPFLQELQPYIGVGGELFLSGSGHKDSAYFSSSTTGFGLRIPVGAEWMIPRAPLGIFVELVPGIGIAPDTFGFFQGGLGIRYYF